MPAEIEVKLRVDELDSLRRRLSELGGEERQAACFETNLLFDDRAGRLLGQGAALRLRASGGRNLLTWKGPKRYQEGIRSREELETEVADAATARLILEALGLRPVLRYEKTRSTWTLGAVEVMLDHTPKGDFVEIEGPVDAVRSTASRLGLDASDGLDATYPSLIGELLDPDAPLEWP